MKSGTAADPLPAGCLPNREIAHTHLLAMLKRCGAEKDLMNARRIHSQFEPSISRYIHIANALIRAYGSCGALPEARQLFDLLPRPTVASWNSLIAGYVDRGHHHQALACFAQMQSAAAAERRAAPSVVTYVSVLKACAASRCLEIGEQIHAKVTEQGLFQKNRVLANALVSMYAKCGALDRAHQVFVELPQHDVVSWTALIAGYAEHGLGDEAIKCFKQMEESAVAPNAVTFISVLKACGAVRSVGMGEEIYGKVRKQGLLKSDIVLGNAVVDMYAKCGDLHRAQKVFAELPHRDVVSWNSLIAGYVDDGFGDEAIKYFRQMEDECVSPDPVTYSCILRACASIGSLEIGEEIHAKIEEQGLLRNDVVLGTTLHDMYIKCGAFQRACQIFEDLPERDVVMWNSLIAAYAQLDRSDMVLDSFRKMRADGIHPNSVTFLFILDTCSHAGLLEQGENFFRDMVLLYGLIPTTEHYSCMVDLCNSAGEFDKAKCFLIHDMSCPKWMRVSGSGNGTKINGKEKYLDILETIKTCGREKDLQKARRVHADMKHWISKDSYVANALIRTYGKCGALSEAQELFDRLSRRGVVSWNVLIAGYVEHGLHAQALQCFRQMEDEGVAPSIVTYVSILRSCANTRCLEIGEKLHVNLRVKGLLKKNVTLGNALINMYGKCNMFKKAHEVCEELTERDVVTWSTLIDGYVEHGLGHEAIKCFRKMEDEGVYPNAVTYICLLKACALIGSLEIGEEIHAKIRTQGLLENSIMLGNTLIDMYAKCGMLKKAHQVFVELPLQDVVSWNALINGYAQLGQVHAVMDAFRRMRAQGVQPNLVTFVVLLNACNHGGLLEQGEKLFHDMIVFYGLMPTVEHHTCMVDLFARAGNFQKAKCFLLDDVTMLLAFLGACRTWEEVDLGKLAIEKIIQLDQDCAAAYVSMQNILSVAIQT